MSFARLGVLVDAVTPSALVQPSADTSYTVLGCIEDFEITPSSDYIERRCAPAGTGKFRTRTKVPISQKLNYAFSMQQWTEMTLVELLQNSDPAASGVYTPNDRGAALEGWLRINAFDHNDVEILDTHILVQLDIGAYKFGENLDPYALTAELLYSSLNDGTATNLT